LAIPVAPDWAAAEDITESKLDSISTVLNWLLNPPHCYAYKTADQSWGSGSFAVVALASEVYDWSVSSMHDTATNNTRLVAPEPGIYTVICHDRFAAAGIGARVMVRKNAAGSPTGGTELFSTFAGSSNNYSFGTIDAQLNASDYVELFAQQGSGGAQDLLGGPTMTFMSLRWTSKQ